MVVTWADHNTVHTFGNSSTFSTPSSGMASGTAPAPTGGAGGFTFGAAPPAAGAPASSGGLFANAPASSGGGLFGATSGAAPAPAFGSTTTSWFGGGQAPALNSTSSTLFGSTSAPAGAPFSTGLFGSTSLGPAANPAPSFGGFGQQQQQQQQQQPQGPLIPAEVAVQAEQNANARNEEIRIQQLFQKIQEAYTDGPARYEKSHPLSMVVYDPASDQQRQLKAIGNSLYYQADGTGGKIVALANPPQLTRDDWYLACLNNPAPETHVPQVVVGAGSLQARALSHQEQARKLFGVQIAALRESHDLLAQRQLARRHQLELLKRRSANLQLLLLRVLKYVHIFRCFKQPLQPDEMKAQERLIALQRQLMQLKPPAMDVSFGTAEGLAAIQAARDTEEEHWMKLVLETRTELAKVTEMLQEDHRDLKLIRERLIDDVATVHRR